MSRAVPMLGSNHTGQTAGMLLCFALAVAGCEKQSSTEAGPRPEASVDRVKALDPDLAQAVAQASARPPSAGGQADGPPQNGVFAPNVADRELALGQPPKITLGGEGTEPRASLALPPLKAGLKQAGTIQVTQQSDGGGLPVEFAVSIEVQKLKAAAAEDAAALAAAAPNAPAPMPVLVRVTGAKLSVAGAPKELEASVAKLKGAKIEYELWPNGAGSGYRYELPKGADPELADVVRALSDVIAVATLPRPDKPLGVGGFWMATSRDGALGLDLLTYRLVKVVKIDGSKVSLSVNTKRYSASPRFDLPGLPPGAPRTLAEFQALAEGTLEVDSTKPFADGGSQNSVMAATLQDPGNPQARGTLEVRTRAELKL